MTDLPRSPGLDWILSFGLAFALSLGAVVFAVCWTVLGWAVSLATGSGVSAVLVAIAVARPESYRALYHLWRRASRKAAGIVRDLALWTLYHLMMRAAALGAPGDLAGGDWDPRSRLPGEAYLSTDSAIEDATRHRWAPSLANWGRRRGRIWVILLLPHLALIRALSSEESGSTPVNIYTLY